MSYREQGIYLNLLMLQFERGDLSLDVIKRYMLRADDWIIEIQEILDDKFTRMPNGTYRNERMAAVIAEQHVKSKRRAQQTSAARASKNSKSRSVTKPVTKPVTEAVTKPVTGRELELELELELEPEKEKEKELSAPALSSGKYAIEDAVQEWNAVAKSHENLATVRVITDKRRRAWRIASKKPGFLANWKAGVKKIPVHNHGSFAWQPTFDWTLNEANITKLCEGNYDAPRTNDRETRVSKFING